MPVVFSSHPATSENDPADRTRFMLWIDGVGAYLLCLGRRVTVGGPGFDANQADVALLANLSRRHVTLVRSREGYWLEAHAPARVARRPVDERTHLNNNCEIELGGNVRMKFRLPTVLSATATLEFLSDHRPSRSVDGVVLMDDTCLLGPGSENHIRCPEWPETVVLFRRDERFWCKSPADLFVGTNLVREAAPVDPGDVVTGADLRFRLEQVD